MDLAHESDGGQIQRSEENQVQNGVRFKMPSVHSCEGSLDDNEIQDANSGDHCHHQTVFVPAL